MPNYKLVNADQLDTDLTTVANKIREKAELSGKLTFPSGFVSGIDQCSSLNFTVVGGTSQPRSPKENTIWVNTSTTITSWVFSAEQPSSPTSGMVWIATGKLSNIAFNALKKNSVQVYPIYAKQYVNYSWVDKTIKAYQGGTWTNCWNGELYDAGEEYELYTGGWTSDGFSYNSSYTTYAGVKNADNFYLKSQGTYKFTALGTANKIDLTNYNTLTVVCEGSEGQISIVGDDKYHVNAIVEASQDGSDDIHIDISTLSGKYYILLSVQNTTSRYLTVYKVYLS